MPSWCSFGALQPGREKPPLADVAVELQGTALYGPLGAVFLALREAPGDPGRRLSEVASAAEAAQRSSVVELFEARCDARQVAGASEG